MKWTTTVTALGQDDLAQLCKTKKIEKIGPASQFAETNCRTVPACEEAEEAFLENVGLPR